MFRFRVFICVLAILAVLAGNFAAVRHGCCQWGPLAARCCCERPVGGCPKCAAMAQVAAQKSAARNGLAKPCRCPQHAEATAVLESPQRLEKLTLDGALLAPALPDTGVCTLAQAVWHRTAPLHPPRNSFAVWQCSWQA